MTPKPLHLLAALSLVATSGAAVAQTAAPLSLASAPMARAGATPGEASELRRPVLWLAGLVALGLVIWGVTELLDDEKAFPTSP
jgi:hypothetical protein